MCAGGWRTRQTLSPAAGTLSELTNLGAIFPVRYSTSNCAHSAALTSRSSRSALYPRRYGHPIQPSRFCLCIAAINVILRYRNGWNKMQRRNRWLKIKIKLRTRRRKKIRRKTSSGITSTTFDLTLKKPQGMRDCPGAFCFSLCTELLRLHTMHLSRISNPVLPLAQFFGGRFCRSVDIQVAGSIRKWMSAGSFRSLQSQFFDDGLYSIFIFGAWDIRIKFPGLRVKYGFFRGNCDYRGKGF
jgi:hypothetical protein